VVYVGRLSQEKGLTPLIRGFAAASRNAPDAGLLLVGDGPIRGELEALARQLNLGPDRIHFVGRVPIGEVPRWLRAGDVFALTSPSEGFSCALLEAMSAGLPSVVSAIPANLQLVDEGVHGLTVPWNDEDRIGEAFLRMFGDPALRRKMGEEARRRVVENYSTDRILDLYERLFEDAMKAQRAGSL
jgi:glycosyltransferase involved in cell wall biosynthesis